MLPLIPTNLLNRTIYAVGNAMETFHSALRVVLFLIIINKMSTKGNQHFELFIILNFILYHNMSWDWIALLQYLQLFIYLKQNITAFTSCIIWPKRVRLNSNSPTIDVRDDLN